MNDEEFDELLRDAAATYNTPPAPPREAMWDAIAAARSAGVVVPIQSGRRAAPWLIGSVAAAAVLMLGIAIGRQSREAELATTHIASTPPASKPIAPALGSPDTSSEVGSSAPVRDLASASTAQGRGLAVSRESGINSRRLDRRGARAVLGSPNSAGNDGFNDANAYRLAVIEHLTRTEVLLTDFRAEARSGTPAKLDAQFAAVSRELLGTTRLLLATRRGEDPVMTRLLQDLEYVLMQLSQYANDGRGVDLDAINQSIDRRNVLPKLRYSIPAGVSASAGT